MIKFWQRGGGIQSLGSPDGTVVSWAEALAASNIVTADSTLTITGLLAQQVAKAFAGTDAPTGALAAGVVKSFSGTEAPTGALTNKQTLIQSVAGTITMAGTLATLVISAIVEPIGVPTLSVNLVAIPFTGPYHSGETSLR